MIRETLEQLLHVALDLRRGLGDAAALQLFGEATEPITGDWGCARDRQGRELHRQSRLVLLRATDSIHFGDDIDALPDPASTRKNALPTYSPAFLPPDSEARYSR